MQFQTVTFWRGWNLPCIQHLWELIRRGGIVSLSTGFALKSKQRLGIVLVFGLGLLVPGPYKSFAKAESSPKRSYELNLESSFGLISQQIAKERDLQRARRAHQFYRQCEHAGTAHDSRPQERQYFCGEYPIGNLDHGLSPRMLNPSYVHQNASKAVTQARRACGEAPKARVTARQKRRTPPSFEVYGDSKMSCTDLPKNTVCKTVRSGRRRIQRCSSTYDYHRAQEVLTQRARAEIGRQVQVWRSKKTIATIPFEYQDKRTTRRMSVYIEALRQQNRGSITISDLHSNRLVSKTVPSSAEGRWNMRVIPSNNDLYISMCLHQPGMTIEIPTVKGKYTWLNKEFIRSTLDYRMELGGLRFNAIEACGLLKVYLDKKGDPQADLISLSQPKLIDPRFKQVKFKIENRWANVLLRIYSIFKNDLQKELVRRYNNELKVLERELEDGTWVKHLPQNLTLTKYIVPHYKRMTDILVSGSSNEALLSIDIAERLQDECQRAGRRTSGLAGKLIEEQCLSMLDSPVMLTPFRRNAFSQNARCYHGYIDIDRARSQIDRAGSQIDRAGSQIDRARSQIDRARSQIDRFGLANTQRNPWFAIYQNQHWFDRKSDDRGCRVAFRLRVEGTPTTGALLRCLAKETNEIVNKNLKHQPTEACRSEIDLVLRDIINSGLDRFLSGDLSSLLTRAERLIKANPELAAKMAPIAQQIVTAARRGDHREINRSVQKAGSLPGAHQAAERLDRSLTRSERRQLEPIAGSQRVNFLVMAIALQSLR